MTHAEPTSSSDATVAAFDFDKTLTNRDCVVPFLARMLTLKRTFGFAVDAPRIGAATLTRDRDVVKAIVTRRAFSGVHIGELEERARQFARHVRERWLRRDTLETLKWHIAQGHRTGIVSASYGLYLRPIAEHLGVDFVLASELEFDTDGRATGRLLGGNCRGPEKARRLEGWLESNGHQKSILFAYGDSAGDREMLQMADKAHLVGRRWSR